MIRIINIFRIPIGSQVFTYTYGKRLFLNHIEEYSEDGCTSLPAYEFEYNETPLPLKISNARDFWGYYNGKRR